MTVLVINSGSSSIKYQLVAPETGNVLASGLVERIGEEIGRYKHEYQGETTELHEPVPDHGVGLRTVVRLFNTIGPSLETADIKAIGHRVVQGGKYFSQAALVDDSVIDRIEQLIPLAPLHNPAHLKGIEVAREIFAGIPNVAVFDTAFFQNLPAEAALYALKRDVAEKYEIRRYGAHGTSHKYVSNIVCEQLKREDAKTIVLHLGNGASASAVIGRQAIDTSMGLTPLEGLVMGSRTGSIDPAAVFHLEREAGMSIDEIDTLFNKQSGLKGLTGDNDMRNIWKKYEAGDPNTIEGIDVYIHRLIHYIGAYAALMGGLDVIAFTAGIGENDDIVRRMVAERLQPFGVELDPTMNAIIHCPDIRTISTDNSTVKVMVIPTNEELAIAQEAMDLVNSTH